MDNRVIAVLEHFGFLTRQEAEHLAEGIKTGVGSESYIGAYNIVKDIITTGQFKERSLLPDLEAKVKDLEAKVATTKAPDFSADIETLESRVKALEAKLTEKNKKSVDVPNKAV